MFQAAVFDVLTKKTMAAASARIRGSLISPAVSKVRLLPLRLQRQDAPPEQVEPGPAIALSLDELQAVDVPLGRPVPPLWG